MPKRKVTDEITATIQHLKRRGYNQSQIAAEVGLDRRTIKAVLERTARAVDYDHWTSVSRAVDAELLRRHYGDLLRLAQVLQETISQLDLVATSPGGQGEELVYSSLGSAIDDERTTGNPRHGRSDRTGRALGNRLFHSMAEHEPTLLSSIKDWAVTFDEFQLHKRALLERGQRGVRQLDLDDESASRVAQVLFRELYERKINRVEPGVFAPLEQEGPTVYIGRRIPNVREQRVYSGSATTAEAVSKRYEALMEAMSKSDPLRRVGKAVEELTGLRDEVDNLIYAMLLRGRPMGRCSLCPYSLL